MTAIRHSLLGATLALALGPAAAAQEEERSLFDNVQEDGDGALFQNREDDGARNPFDPAGTDGEDLPDGFSNVIEGERVVLRGLNKVTAATSDLTAEFEEPLQFGSMTVVARYCSRRPPEFIPETFVFMEIYDRTFDGAEEGEYGQKIFSGWMLGSSPGLHGLEHPVYDIWPVECEVAEGALTAPPPPEEIAAADAAEAEEADEDAPAFD